MWNLALFKQNYFFKFKAYFRKSYVFHGIEPVIDVVGVSELKTVRFVARLIFVVDFLEGHFLGTEKIRQLGQVHAIA